MKTKTYTLDASSPFVSSSTILSPATVHTTVIVEETEETAASKTTSLDGNTRSNADLQQQLKLRLQQQQELRLAQTQLHALLHKQQELAVLSDRMRKQVPSDIVRKQLVPPMMHNQLQMEVMIPSDAAMVSSDSVREEPTTLTPSNNGSFEERLQLLLQQEAELALAETQLRSLQTMKRQMMQDAVARTNGLHCRNAADDCKDHPRSNSNSRMDSDLLHHSSPDIPDPIPRSDPTAVAPPADTTINHLLRDEHEESYNVRSNESYNESYNDEHNEESYNDEHEESYNDEHHRLYNSLSSLAKELQELEIRQSQLLTHTSNSSTAALTVGSVTTNRCDAAVHTNNTLGSPSHPSASSASSDDNNNNYNDGTVKHIFARLVAASVHDQLQRQMSATALPANVDSDDQNSSEIDSNASEASCCQTVIGPVRHNKDAYGSSPPVVAMITPAAQREDSDPLLAENDLELTRLASSFGMDIEETNAEIHDGMTQINSQLRVLEEARKYAPTAAENAMIDQMTEKLLAQAKELMAVKQSLSYYQNLLSEQKAMQRLMGEASQLKPCHSITNSSVLQEQTGSQRTISLAPEYSAEGVSDTTLLNSRAVATTPRYAWRGSAVEETPTPVPTLAPLPQSRPDPISPTRSTHARGTSTLHYGSTRPTPRERNQLGSMDFLHPASQSFDVAASDAQDITGAAMDDPEFSGDHYTVDDDNLENTHVELSDMQRLFLHHKDDIYRSVANTISSQESHPYFLIKIFKNLPKLTSNYARDRLMIALDEIIEEAESCALQVSWPAKGNADSDVSCSYRNESVREVRSDVQKPQAIPALGRQPHAVQSMPISTALYPPPTAATMATMTDDDSRLKSCDASRLASKPTTMRLPRTSRIQPIRPCEQPGSPFPNSASTIEETPSTLAQTRSIMDPLCRMIHSSMQTHLNTLLDQATLPGAPVHTVYTHAQIKEIIVQTNSVIYAYASFKHTALRGESRDLRDDDSSACSLSGVMSDDQANLHALAVVDELRPIVEDVFGNYLGLHISECRLSIGRDMKRLLDTVFGVAGSDTDTDVDDGGDDDDSVGDAGIQRGEGETTVRRDGVWVETVLEPHSTAHGVDWHAEQHQGAWNPPPSVLSGSSKARQSSCPSVPTPRAVVYGCDDEMYAAIEDELDDYRLDNDEMHAAIEDELDDYRLDNDEMHAAVEDELDNDDLDNDDLDNDGLDDDDDDEIDADDFFDQVSNEVDYDEDHVDAESQLMHDLGNNEDHSDGSRIKILSKAVTASVSDKDGFSSATYDKNVDTIYTKKEKRGEHYDSDDEEDKNSYDGECVFSDAEETQEKSTDKMDELEAELLEARVSLVEQQSRIDMALEDTIKRNHVAGTFTDLQSPRKPKPFGSAFIPSKLANSPRSRESCVLSNVFTDARLIVVKGEKIEEKRAGVESRGFTSVQDPSESLSDSDSVCTVRPS
ncbi:hypothetical protein BASA50_009613 [Batrachochytrium salamandrivorans]|uniref:Pericentriolar material 1 protein C-terminal domain-containing protein n=1 Tax=Batrachochytrium salamandrivorans TaxID=1357716 RepID=A0ABQ8F0U8_9FUNG|nr:hypothetical protein BASA62_006223 [Batrachochytrium salamandrivorans]KAH6590127.1 hypothetical protein BASA50_009613 [Batrachochytrium salamandrivorans]